MDILGPKRVGSIAVASGGGGTGSLDLPRNRFIQKIYGHLRVVGDTDAAVTPDEDAIAALISSIRVVVNGDDARVSAPLIDLYHYTRQRSRNTGLQNSLLTTVSQSNVVIGECDFAITFATEQDEHLNAEDVSALLPAHEASSLSIEVNFAGAAALGTGYTVDSGSLEISIKEFALTPEEVAEVIVPGKYWVYYLTGFDNTIAAQSVNFDNVVNPPIGKILRRTMLTSIRNGVRVNGVFDAQTGLYEYEFVDSRKGDIPVIRQSWDNSQLQDRLEYGIDPPTGITIADFVEIGNIDARGYSQGQIELKFNNQSPTGVTSLRILNEQLAGAGS